MATIDAFALQNLLYTSDSNKKRITDVGLKFPRSMNLNLSAKMLFCELRKCFA